MNWERKTLLDGEGLVEQLVFRFFPDSEYPVGLHKKMTRVLLSYENYACAHPCEGEEWYEYVESVQAVAEEYGLLAFLDCQGSGDVSEATWCFVPKQPVYFSDEGGGRLNCTDVEGEI